MRVSARHLRKIIREELSHSLREADPQVDYDTNIAANMTGDDPGMPGKRVTGSDGAALRWLRDWFGLEDSDMYDTQVQSNMEDALYTYSAYIQMKDDSTDYEDLQSDWFGMANQIAALAGEPVTISGNFKGFKQFIEAVQDIAAAEAPEATFAGVPGREPGTKSDPYTANLPYATQAGVDLPNDINVMSDKKWSYRLVTPDGKGNWTDDMDAKSLQREIPFLKDHLDANPGNKIYIVGASYVDAQGDTYGYTVRGGDQLDRFMAPAGKISSTTPRSGGSSGGSAGAPAATSAARTPSTLPPGISPDEIIDHWFKEVSAKPLKVGSSGDYVKIAQELLIEALEEIASRPVTLASAGRFLVNLKRQGKIEGEETDYQSLIRSLAKKIKLSGPDGQFGPMTQAGIYVVQDLTAGAPDTPRVSFDGVIGPVTAAILARGVKRSGLFEARTIARWNRLAGLMSD